MREEGIRDRCAVFGIWGVSKPAEYVYLALHNLQHRGQEASGIVTASQRKLHSHHGMGIVNDVFSEHILHELDGRGAIGHNRYATFGSSTLANAQPFVAETQNGPVALAHNGQFANCQALRRRLTREGCIFKTDSDSEVVLHYFARARGRSQEEIVASCFRELKPAYSLVLLTLQGLYAIRDPSGVRPLVLGRLPASRGDSPVCRRGAYAVASETPAFDIIGAKYLGEVQPGEMVVIDDRGLRRIRLFPPGEELRCVFEHVYFARPDSFLFGAAETTGEVRKEFGRQLWREHPAKADVVIPVPDSSTFAALGFAHESGIPFDYGLIRSHYIGRTFIEPTQAIRDAKVRKKYNPNRSVLKGKRVVLVEDSIVRGTTLKNIVRLIRDFGARQVHVRVSSPPYRYSCYLGIDTAETRRLIAHTKSVAQIRDFLGADSLGYLSQEGMLANRLLSGGYCTFCFNGITRIRPR
jgi:amidophosphoribosyltransferase